MKSLRPRLLFISLVTKLTILCKGAICGNFEAVSGISLRGIPKCLLTITAVSSHGDEERRGNCVASLHVGK